MNRKYDEVKCIWADSGIIGYKLCDKNFDCENCELDKVLRKTATINTEIERNKEKPKTVFGEVISEINSLKFDKHYSSLKNYLCLKNLFGDKYFIGISPLLYSLFYKSDCSFNCVKEYEVNPGEKIAEVSSSWGSSSIASPIAMKVLKQIPQKNGDINSSNWVGIVEIEKEDFESSIITEGEFQHNKNYIVSLLQSKEAESFNDIVTLFDGGNKISSLPQLLGPAEFCRMINHIIHSS